MKLLDVGNGLHAQVDDDVYKRFGAFEWTLMGGKPYLKVAPPGWEGSRFLARQVLNTLDPNVKVIARDGYVLNCVRSNLFKGTSAQCQIFRQQHPLSESERPRSKYCGVIWYPEIRAWGLDYANWPMPKLNPQWFSSESDAAAYFDERLEQYVEVERLAITNAQIAIEERADEFRFTAASLLAQLNFGGLEWRAF